MQSRTRKTTWLLIVLPLACVVAFFCFREVGQAVTASNEAHDHGDHDADGDHGGHDAHEGHDAHDERDAHDADGEQDAHEGHDDHSAHEGEHDSHAEAGHTGEEDVEEHGAHAEEGHEHEEGEALIRLSKEEWVTIGIVTQVASPGSVTRDLVLPAEVRLNEDRVAHVVPRAPGIVREVHKTIGDVVEAGEVIAILDSRELADAQAEYLAANARLALAQKELQREKSLWEQEISAERDYLVASRELEESRIVVRVAEQKLRALGFSKERLRRIRADADDLTRYEMNAPFAGEIIERHIVLGEALDAQSVAFIIADLSSVWVDVKVYEKDLPRIAEGQGVRVTGPAELPVMEGQIAYIAPIVEKETRTALARIVLPNDDGQWRPGLFLDVSLVLEAVEASVVVPKSAIQRLEDASVVFVETEEGLKPTEVELGQESGERIAIVAGLARGQRFVTEGAFELKAKLVTSGLGAHAGHGH